MHTRTPTGGPGLTRAITTAKALQDDRRRPRGTKDEIQDNSNVRRLPTVYFLQCSTTVPAIRGKTTTSAPYTRVRRPLLVTIKGGGGPPLRGAGLIWTHDSSRLVSLVSISQENSQHY